MGAKAIFRVISASLVFASLSGLSVCMTIYLLPNSPIIALPLTVVAVLMMMATLVCWDISRLHPDDTHTLSSLLHMYYHFRIESSGIQRKVRLHLENIAEDGMKAQHEFLMKIIQDNCDTVYGRHHRLAEIKNREDFKRNHPLTTFSHYESYSKRIANGEKNLLTKAEVIYLALSSGTTGKTKMYPITNAIYDTSWFISGYLSLHLSKICRDTALKKKLLFRVFHPQRRSPGGLLMGGLGQIVLKSNPKDGNVTPPEFLEIFDEGAIFYVQALFALADPEIGIIEGFSADLMYSFFNFIMKHRDALCQDIKQGDIRHFPKLPDHVRIKMAEKMSADPYRAQEVYTILSGLKKGLARRLWPDLQFVMVAKTGGFANSFRLLSRSYLQDVPASCPMHGATEGMIGAKHIDDQLTDDIYTFLPDMTFFEFIPLEERMSDTPKTLFLDQVKVGGRYELVVSNQFGLYRNRFGDVIEIVGFHRTLPKYRFLYRTGQILTIAYDRTPELIVYEAIRRTEARWKGLTIDNYTSTESFHLDELLGQVFSPACYVLFMEVVNGTKDVRLTNELCRMFEEVLCELHEAYAEYRGKGSISPAKIIQVKQGTFAHLQNTMQSARASVQFKMPRVLRSEAHLRILMEGKVQCL